MSSKSELIDDLTTLNQIAQTLNQSVDMHGALNDALARLVELMDLDSGWIFLRDEAAADSWWGTGYRLAAHYHLPPALALDNPAAWKGGCDCEGFCNTGKLTEAYNEVRCSRLGDVTGDRRGLVIHASTPLQSREEVLGILNVAAPDWESFGPRRLSLLTTVGTQMGAALERARLFDLLQERRVLEQAALLDLSGQLLGRLELDDVVNYLVEEVKRLLSVDAAALFLLEDDVGQLAFRAAAGWRTDPVAGGRRVPSDDRSSSGWVVRNQKPLLIHREQDVDDAPIWTAEWLREEDFWSSAIVPLISVERTIGTAAVYSRQPRTFTEDDVRFLQLMANQAAIAIEKARLHKEELRRLRLEEELAVARQIQLSLLPKSCPMPAGWQFCDYYQAARQVGGDFYDFFELPGETPCMGLVIADVSDKGVPAALFMGVSRTVIRSLALGGARPKEVLEQANKHIAKESQSDLFLSVFYAVLELESGQLVYANAGHNPPLHYHEETGEVSELGTEGLVLCVLEEITQEEKRVNVARGDVLVFYTDGVTEAINSNHDEFGEPRLRQAVASAAKESATQILHAVVDGVQDFAGAMDQSDDFTLFVVKRL